MMALNSHIQYIVHEQWLLDSAKKGKLLPVLTPPLSTMPVEELNTRYSSLQANNEQNQKEYKDCLSKSTYLIQDNEKETLWDFSLVDTLTLIRFSYNPFERIREHRSHVFQDYAIFLTKGLCGVSAPSEEEMKQIIITGGGIWLNSLSEFFQLSSSSSSTNAAAPDANTGGRKKKGTAETAAITSSTANVNATISQPQQLLVISHATVSKKELKKDSLEKIKSTGARGIYTIELLFQGVLRQKLDLSKSFLEEF